MLLRTLGDPVLRGECLPYINGRHSHLVEQMFEAMESFGGVGLAAPQVGESIQLFVYEWAGELHAVGNPAVRSRVGPMVSSTEGCLSIPGEEFAVRRYHQINYTGFDAVHGNQFDADVSGFEATIIQHELDHLRGRLILDTGEPV